MPARSSNSCRLIALRDARIANGDDTAVLHDDSRRKAVIRIDGGNLAVLEDQVDPVIEGEGARHRGRADQGTAGRDEGPSRRFLLNIQDLSRDLADTPNLRAGVAERKDVGEDAFGDQQVTTPTARRGLRAQVARVGVLSVRTLSCCRGAGRAVQTLDPAIAVAAFSQRRNRVTAADCQRSARAANA